MLRQSTRRSFFTLPSLAFFDGTNVRASKRVHLTPGNFVEIMCQTMKDDWRLVPQPKPASQVHFLLVNKSNKVCGRVRPPLCVPLPRHSVRDGGITQQQLLDFHENNDGTWFLACTERAVGVAIVDKQGQIADDSMRSFSLLIHNDSVPQEFQQHFIRPGIESPLYGELFEWISERVPRLDQCCNWFARRDEPDHITFDHLRVVMRSVEREQRFESNNAAAAEELAAVGGDPTSATMRKFTNPEDENSDMYGGHGQWTPEGAAAASQFALERRSILDNPRWCIVPPFTMPSRELVQPRLPNDVNVLGGVGRLRQGLLELL